MAKNSLLDDIHGGLIVSCQAQEPDSMYGSGLMTRMAMAAKQGGAIGIRANGAADIASIKEATGLPVIGIVKRHYGDSDVYITATMREVDEIAAAGADVIALDATNRLRPGGITSREFIMQVKARYPDILVMADVSMLEEGVVASAAGADLIASTLSGYTPYSPQQTAPDFQLVESLASQLSVPVIMEGRVRYPDEARRCLELGCWAVVVGSAITRPQEITRSFVKSIRGLHESNQPEMMPYMNSEKESSSSAEER